MLGSTFRHCRLWGASIAAILAASLSPLGYSQGYSQAGPKPARLPRRTAGAASPGNSPGKIDYTRDIHAIFAAHCLACHNAEKRSGGLSLGAYADIIAG